MQYIKTEPKDIGNLNRLICREDIEKLDNKVPFPKFHTLKKSFARKSYRTSLVV